MISKEDLERWANDYGIAQALSVVGELARELIAAREELGRQHHGLMQTIEMQKERIEEREAECDAAIERAEKAEEKLAAFEWAKHHTVDECVLAGQAPVTSAQPVTKTGHQFLDLLGLSFPAPVASEPSQPRAPEPPTNTASGCYSRKEGCEFVGSTCTHCGRGHRRASEPPAASEPPRPPAEVWIVGVAPDMKPLTWAASEEESAKYGGGGAHVAGPYVLARPTVSDEGRARAWSDGNCGGGHDRLQDAGCVADLAALIATIRAEVEAKGRAAGLEEAATFVRLELSEDLGEDLEQSIRALAKGGGK